MTSPAVELRRLTKLYREGDTERVVFRDVTATVKAGEIAVLVGRSGSGKSTLLNLISGIDLPTSGSVLVAGTEPRGRRVIGLLLGRDHPVGDILHALALDPPRRAFTSRVGIEQKRHHLDGSNAARPHPSMR